MVGMIFRIHGRPCTAEFYALGTYLLPLNATITVNRLHDPLPSTPTSTHCTTPALHTGPFSPREIHINEPFALFSNRGSRLQISAVSDRNAISNYGVYRAVRCGIFYVQSVIKLHILAL
jgi:hypothetical protein